MLQQYKKQVLQDHEHLFFLFSIIAYSTDDTIIPKAKQPSHSPKSHKTPASSETEG